jgi:hypothetical protein
MEWVSFTIGWVAGVGVSLGIALLVAFMRGASR